MSGQRASWRPAVLSLPITSACQLLGSACTVQRTAGCAINTILLQLPEAQDQAVDELRIKVREMRRKLADEEQWMASQCEEYRDGMDAWVVLAMCLQRCVTHMAAEGLWARTRADAAAARGLTAEHLFAGARSHYNAGRVQQAMADWSAAFGMLQRACGAHGYFVRDLLAARAVLYSASSWVRRPRQARNASHRTRTLRPMLPCRHAAGAA